jgi:hypothetical protein
MIWRQTSDPYANSKTKTSGVTGYEAVSIPKGTGGHNWGGLEYDAANECLFDGSVGSTIWFYCIGWPDTNWGPDGIPSFARAAKAVELFARDPRRGGIWTLLFRQTLPTTWDKFEDNKYSVNPKDPANSSYAILDQFAEFKNPADGTFELKLTWPDRWQIWSQSSNPTTTKTTVDYNAIDVQFPNSFGGLHLNSADPALRESVLDGADDSSTTWFNAVGYEGADWGSKSIPAGNTGDLASGAKQAELYVQRVAE